MGMGHLIQSVEFASGFPGSASRPVPWLPKDDLSIGEALVMPDGMSGPTEISFQK